MSKERIIRVKAVQDQEFKNSYWSFDIQEELQRAFSEFRRQFGVGFRITKIEDWNSIGSPGLRDFPLNILKRLQRRASETEIVEDLVRIVNNQMKIPWEISPKEKRRFLRVLKKKSKDYQLGYLMGLFSSFLSDYLLSDLMKKTPKKTEADIIIGFTGKIVIFPEQETFPLGRAVREADLGEDAYIVMGICVGLVVKPSQAILHELGHIFGARHIENKLVSSVMTQNPRETTYNFDPKNKKIIRDFLTKLS